jgi:hypothetical protein
LGASSLKRLVACLIELNPLGDIVFTPCVYIVLNAFVAELNALCICSSEFSSGSP